MEEIIKILQLWKVAPYLVSIAVIIVYWKKIFASAKILFNFLRKMFRFFDWYEQHASETKDQYTTDMGTLIGEIKDHGAKFEAYAAQEAKAREVFIQQLLELRIDHERTKKNTDKLTLRVDELEKDSDEIREHIKLPKTKK
jgi:hypothetical protein